MHALVGEKGQANHGCFDGPIRFNPEDFKLRGFFGREIRGFRKKLAFGAFNFLGIVTDDFLVGMAAVRLGYAANVFGYLFDFRTGKLFEGSAQTLPGSLQFPLDPDASTIRFSSSKCQLRLDKSHAREHLEVEARFGQRLAVKGSFPYGFRHRPLRVVNPSCGDPNRFTFTEKCSPLRPETLSVVFDGVERVVDLDRAVALYDWSAGYFNRHTNWLWSAFAGLLADGTPVGANFAALVNESYYPENAFWIGGERTRVSRVIFEYDVENPYAEEWRIHTEDGQVDLRFRPLGERGEQTRLPFIKVNFRQFMGEYQGRLTDAQGRSIELESFHGLAETHLSVW